ALARDKVLFVAPGNIRIKGELAALVPVSDAAEPRALVAILAGGIEVTRNASDEAVIGRLGVHEVSGPPAIRNRITAGDRAAHPRPLSGTIEIVRVGDEESVVDPQRIVDVERNRALPKTRGVAPRVVGGQGSTDSPARGVLDLQHRCAWRRARADVDLGVVAGKAVELVDPLLGIAEIEDLARHPGKSRCGVRTTGRLDFDALDLTLDHHDRQPPFLRVLRRHVGSGRDVASRDVKVGYLAQERIQLPRSYAVTHHAAA